MYNVLKDKVHGDLCVSISGGVDSMVLTYLLKRLEKILKINVCAFHITRLTCSLAAVLFY